MWPYLLVLLLVSEFKLQYPTQFHFIEVRAQIRGYHCAHRPVNRLELDFNEITHKHAHTLNLQTYLRFN